MDECDCKMYCCAEVCIAPRTVAGRGRIYHEYTKVCSKTFPIFFVAQIPHAEMLCDFYGLNVTRTQCQLINTIYIMSIMHYFQPRWPDSVCWAVFSALQICTQQQTHKNEYCFPV